MPGTDDPEDDHINIMQRLTIPAIGFVVLETKELPYLTGTTVLFWVFVRKFAIRL